jgi:prevent-host-death family protein
MTELTLSEARSDLAQLVERVHHRLERVCLTKHGCRVVAIVPIEDLELLEKLEGRFDRDAVRTALAEAGLRFDYARLREELGLSARVAPRREGGE